LFGTWVGGEDPTVGTLCPGVAYWCINA